MLLLEPLPPLYFIRVISTKWLQSEASLPVSFRHLITPDKFPRPTALNEEMILRPSDLGWAPVKDLFDDFTEFNMIQNPVAKIAFETDDNILLTAPSGSGKTAIAELAISRLMKQAETGDQIGKAVYISDSSDLISKFKKWSKAFSGLSPIILTGDMAGDRKLIRSSGLILSTL